MFVFLQFLSFCQAFLKMGQIWILTFPKVIVGLIWVRFFGFHFIRLLLLFFFLNRLHLLSNFYLIESWLQSFQGLFVTGEYHIFFDWGRRLNFWLKHRSNDSGCFIMDKGGNWGHNILNLLSFTYFLTTFLQSLPPIRLLRSVKQFQVLLKRQSFISVWFYCLLKYYLLSGFLRRFL